MSLMHPTRSRPRDRKWRIEEAAALAFAQHGYYGVSMSDVATAVGISAPALYRHFPNKYALFQSAAFRVAHRLVEDTQALAADVPDSPEMARGQLDDLVDAVIATTIDLRSVGGIYRWEGRYLTQEDRASLTAEFDTLRQRVLVPLRIYRPELSPDSCERIVWAALSVVASITAHRTTVGSAALRTALRGAAWRVLDAHIAEEQTPFSTPATDDADDARRARLVSQAIALFARRGYHDVTIEEIASAVGLTASGVYRHFESKADLLLTACEQAAVRFEAGMARAQALTDRPGEAVRMLAADYVQRSVSNRDLARVYFSDVSNLADEQRRRLYALQKTYISEWVELLLSARPELNKREAVVLVHAAFGVVADLGTLARLRRVDFVASTVALVEAVLDID